MALATGGSTGRRGVFVFDPAAKAMFILSIIRSLLARLHAAGGIPPGGLPMVMAGAGSAVHATAAAAAETVGTDVPVRITSVPVTVPWPQMVDRLNALQPPALIGFASALAQPLIGYELADSFVLEPSAGGPGHLLARARGRADEVFHYPAGELHPHVIRSVMLRSPEVADYQVRQTRTGIEADIIAASGGASTEALRRRLAEALAHGGLSQPDVMVRIAGDLPRCAGSGKLRRFIPLSRVA